MSTRKEIAEVIGYLKLSFPNFNPTLEGTITTVDVYLDLLGDLPVDTLRAAVKACCSQIGRAFAPSPGEIREAAVKLHIKAAGLPDTYSAWEMVLNEIRRVGSYGKPVFEHDIISRAVDCLGWQYLCLSENIMADRAHFFKVYEAFFQRATEDAAELPALTNYIQERKRIGGAIAMLTDKLAVKR